MNFVSIYSKYREIKLSIENNSSKKKKEGSRVGGQMQVEKRAARLGAICDCRNSMDRLLEKTREEGGGSVVVGGG